MSERFIISLSGGIASAASAIIADREGYDYDLVFADTTIEDADLYRFISEIADALGKPLNTCQDGRDPWDTFVANKVMGNNRFAPCSRVLKTEQVAAWIDEHGSRDDVLVLGMYRDEEDRLERAQRNWAPMRVCSLLIDHKVTPAGAAEMVHNLGVRSPGLYDLGFPHNNCGGFCIRAGQGQFATLLDKKPDFYAAMEAREQWAIGELRAAGASEAATGGFIRVMRKGVTRYLSMKQFREEVQAGKLAPKMYEMGGCGCFVDDLLTLMEKAA